MKNGLQNVIPFAISGFKLLDKEVEEPVRLGVSPNDNLDVLDSEVVPDSERTLEIDKSIVLDPSWSSRRVS